MNKAEESVYIAEEVKVVEEVVVKSETLLEEIKVEQVLEEIKVKTEDLVEDINKKILRELQKSNLPTQSRGCVVNLYCVIA